MQGTGASLLSTAGLWRRWTRPRKKSTRRRGPGQAFRSHSCPPRLKVPPQPHAPFLSRSPSLRELGPPPRSRLPSHPRLINSMDPKCQVLEFYLYEERLTKALKSLHPDLKEPIFNPPDFEEDVMHRVTLQEFAAQEAKAEKLAEEKSRSERHHHAVLSDDDDDSDSDTYTFEGGRYVSSRERKLNHLFDNLRRIAIKYSSDPTDLIRRETPRSKSARRSARSWNRSHQLKHVKFVQPSRSPSIKSLLDASDDDGKSLASEGGQGAEEEKTTSASASVSHAPPRAFGVGLGNTLRQWHPRQRRLTSQAICFYLQTCMDMLDAFRGKGGENILSSRVKQIPWLQKPPTPFDVTCWRAGWRHLFWSRGDAIRAVERTRAEEMERKRKKEEEKKRRRQMKEAEERLRIQMEEIKQEKQKKIENERKYQGGLPGWADFEFK